MDIHVQILEKMYQRRLNGYAAMDYKMKAGTVETDAINIIFDKESFLPVYSHDVAAAKREILIVSPFATKRRAHRMLPLMETAVKKGVRTIVATRQPEDFREKDAAMFQGTLDSLKNAGVSMLFRSNIHQKFAVIDQTPASKKCNSGLFSPLRSLSTSAQQNEDYGPGVRQSATLIKDHTRLGSLELIDFR